MFSSGIGAGASCWGPAADEFCGGAPLWEEAAFTAAFKTCANGGLIPHARHGSIGNDDEAVPASKLSGTGFENVQIGQIHVPLACLGRAGEPEGARGLLVRDIRDDAEDEWADEVVFSRFDCRRRGPPPCLGGLGYRITLGDDRRNPA